MSEWISNTCGGARFRTLDNFLIEIEGEGVPYFKPGSSNFKYLEQTWKNFGGLLRKYAGDNGIPTSYALAIATQETGYKSADRNTQATIGSPAGAQGVMQLMPCSVVAKFCGVDRTDPAQNIKAGVSLLAAKVRALKGLPPAASSYNKGSLACYSGPTSNPAVVPNVFGWYHEHNYSYQVSKYNNSAILYLGANTHNPILSWLFGGGVLAGATIYALKRRSSRR